MDAGESEERRNALAKDAHFRLMMRLLSFDRSDEEKGQKSSHASKSLTRFVLALDQKWFIPSTILPSNLSISIGALRQYLDDPPSLEAGSKTLLRKARRPRARRIRDDDDGEEPRQRRIKVAEVQSYKSAAFIEDSDDDEEADRAFFEREKALRAEMDEVARRQGSQMVLPAPKMKEKRQRMRSPLESDDDSDSGNAGTSDALQRSRRKRKDSTPDSDDSADSDSSDVESESGEAERSSPIRPVAQRVSSPTSPTIASSPPEESIPMQGVKRKAVRLIASDSEDD